MLYCAVVFLVICSPFWWCMGGKVTPVIFPISRSRRQSYPRCSVMDFSLFILLKSSLEHVLLTLHLLQMVLEFLVFEGVSYFSEICFLHLVYLFLCLQTNFQNAENLQAEKRCANISKLH